MPPPSPNASDAAWSAYLNSLSTPALLDAWIAANVEGIQRVKTMAMLVAGSRLFSLAMQARIMEQQLSSPPCAD